MRSRREREAKAHWRPELFTNREAELAAFRDLLANLGPDHASVLALHGISGNGKTWLARQLRHELRERPPHASVPHAFIDLDGAADLADHEFLRRVRNGLAETGGIRFTAFDIAFALFWREAFPHTALPQLTGSVIVPASGNLADQLAAPVELGELSGLVAAGFPLVRRLSEEFVRWLAKGHHQATNAVLRALLQDRDDVSPQEVLLHLPHFLACDVADWRHSTPERPVAIICDTWETTRAQGGAVRSTESVGPVGEMLRELVVELPRSAIVVLGRERLDWPAGADGPAAALHGGERRLDGLARAHGVDYLRRRGIADAEVRAAILDTATVTPDRDEVYPLFLDLLAGLHDDLAARGEAPRPPDFVFAVGGDLDARTRRIVDRVVRDYDHPLRAMLQRLGVARRFDAALTQALNETFGLGFAADRFRDLAALSLVDEDDGDCVLHARIADCLAARLDADARLATHRRLHLAFLERAAAAAEGLAAVAALGRAADHAIADPALRPRLGEWWAAMFDAFEARVGPSLFEPLARRMVEVFEPEGSDERGRAFAFNILGDVRVARGDLGGAFAAYEAGLGIAERLAAGDPSNTEWQRDLSVSHNKIGDVREARGELVGALSAYEAGLAICERLAAGDASNTGWQRDLSVSFERLGDIALRRNAPTEAADYFERSLRVMRPLAEADADHAAFQRHVAVTLSLLGDALAAAERRDEAAEAYGEGLARLERLAEAGRLEPRDAWLPDELRRRLAAVGG